MREALDAGVSLKTMAARLGWPRGRVFMTAFDPAHSPTIDDLAAWYFAVDGSLLEFSMVPR